MSKNWYRLDTAALIFPAIRRKNWCNVFRVSAELAEPIDPEVLDGSVQSLRRRFPSFYVTLQKGAFWYYLEESTRPVSIRPDYAYPLTYMDRNELKSNCLRILYHGNRLAVECFHSVTDGHGGMLYLCNLIAEYLEKLYGIRIPEGGLILDRSVPAEAEELEDSFLRHSAAVASARNTDRSYRLRGTAETNGFRHLTTGILDSKQLLETAHRFGGSVTSFLSAVMIQCIMELQASRVPLSRQRPVRVTLPVDLRRLFPSRTLRNFSLVLNVGEDPRFGPYSIEDLTGIISHQLKAQATRQNMSGIIASNVLPQKVPLLRIAPVFIKDLVLDAVYRKSGECGGCLNISNLGSITLPKPMLPYIKRLDFIIGPQRSYPNNCSVVSFRDKTYINMIRNIRESELERRFFSRLVELGIPVEIESNSSRRK